MEIRFLTNQRTFFFTGPSFKLITAVSPRCQKEPLPALIALEPCFLHTLYRVFQGTLMNLSIKWTTRSARQPKFYTSSLKTAQP